MLRDMSPRLLYQWMAYADLEPFDERRADWRAASIVTMLANINRDPKKRPEPYSYSDFVLQFGEAAHEAPKKQTPEQQMNILTWFAMAHGKPRVDPKEAPANG